MYKILIKYDNDKLNLWMPYGSTTTSTTGKSEFTEFETDDVIQMLVGWNDISMVQLYKDISCDEQFEKYFGEEGIKTVEQKSLSDM